MTRSRTFLVCTASVFGLLLILIYWRNAATSLNPYQVSIKREIEKAGTLERFLPVRDTIRLRVPEEVVVDVLPKAAFFSGGFVLFNPMARTIVLVSKSGEFIRTIGGPGAGAGKFRSLNVGAVDIHDNIYTLDNVLGQLTVFSTQGEVLRSFRIENAHFIRYLCVNSTGDIYLHHVPDSTFSGFVSIYRSDRFQRCVVPPISGYEAYYFHGHLDGRMALLRSGTVLECNSFTSMISRINPEDGVTTFGEKFDGYRPLPYSPHFPDVEHVLDAVRQATIIRGLFIVDMNRLIMLESATYFPSLGETKRFMQIYDTTGTCLGKLRIDTITPEVSDGERLLRIYNPPPVPGINEREIRVPQIVLYSVGRRNT